MKPRQPMLLPYPAVLSEIETMRRVVAGASLARFGDGELRLVDGGSAISQRATKAIRADLKHVLSDTRHNTLVGIPHMQTPKYEKTWHRYEGDKYVRYYTRAEYGSAFITRPDSAPWIDTPEYWGLVSQLWVGQDITLVISEQHSSIRPSQLEGAASLKVVEGPRRDAHDRMSELVEEIGPLAPGQRVLLCLGACATVLAVLLNSRYNAHAVDLGHIGRYMRKQGQFSK